MPKLSSTTVTAPAAAVSKKTAEVVATPAKTPKVKSESKKSTESSVPAPVVVAEKTAATPAPKKKAAKVAPVVAAVNEVVAVSTEPASSAVPATPSSEYSEFMTKLQLVSTMLSSLRGDFRSLEKKNSRDLKIANKANAKRARKQKGNRSPSGFVKPTLISTELACFLGKEAGTQMARTEVTREINTYIRANSLQDKENGRKINADEKLSSLLKLTKGEELTYFNLQRYMSPHFIKTPAVVVVA